MNQLLCDHLEKLKSALLSLSATGTTGFEGLIGTALTEICGVPFRLASSGSQFGIDGKPAYDGDALCFEGKRYDKSIPRAEVLSKIAEFSITDSAADIWILGSTTQVGSQLADSARALGRKSGISVLILDWSGIGLPPLSVALAMGAQPVQDFLVRNLHDNTMAQDALAALTAIVNSDEYAAHESRIRSECDTSSVGLPQAKKGNGKWLLDAFSNSTQARMKLGQPLSPGEANQYTLPRRDLIERINAAIMGPPEESVIVVLGDEGHGKSWAVAQSWLSLPHKPLTVILSPEEFEESSRIEAITDLLITTIINQTGDEPSSTTRKRWERLFKQWQGQQVTERPRIIVLIDGINQRPNNDWARIVERIVHFLHHLGGRLIVTVRSSFFQSQIKNRLFSRRIEIIIPEWSAGERDEILARHGMKALDLHSAVANSMRNPRLLGLAVELFDKAAITHFEELTVSRLLFEHLRMTERDAATPQSAFEFALTLQEHAQTILSRVEKKQKDDLTIFKGRVAAVADGRFFHAVDGDPTSYSLKDDGLTLALGFAVVDKLRIGHRNAHNLDEKLNALLEPIAALDDTADVILAALTVTIVADDLHPDITNTLVKGFCTLQNPNDALFPAFSGLVKSHPRDFMAAARMLCLSGGHHANFDWVEGALIVAGKDPRAWPAMIDEVKSWLSTYSVSPARGCFKSFPHDSLEKVKEEQERNREKIQKKLNALSPSEQAILKRLEKADGNLSRLSRLGLILLAGHELFPFANSLLNWAFSNALNSDHAAPYNDFFNLIRLNKVDWAQARAALLEASSELRKPGVSSTGKWSLVNILRGTGHPADWEEMLALVTELTKDRAPFPAWNRLKDLCDTDPCDPLSETPKNLSLTVTKYSAIDVGTLRNGRGQSSEDLFFSEGRPAMARFALEAAVGKHKEFIADVVGRKDPALSQGLLEVHDHNALLAVDIAIAFLRKRNETIANCITPGIKDQNAWASSQYSLLVAFPLLNARKQTELLLADNSDENVMLSIMEVAKPLNERELEDFLERTCREGAEWQQYMLLALAKYTSAPLSPPSQNSIAKLYQSASPRVRAYALAIISQSGERELLEQVSKSAWTAAGTEDDVEKWYGSRALLKAASSGLIEHYEALERIAPDHYGLAAVILNADVVRNIGYRLDESIRHVLNVESDLTAMDIELRISPPGPHEPPLYTLNERTDEKTDIKERVRQISFSRELWDQRQKRLREAFQSFRASLSQAKALIVLDNINSKHFETIIEVNPELGNKWYTLFMSIPKAKRPIIHNLAILLAHAFRKDHPAKAKSLYQLVKDIEPMVSFTIGRARVPFEGMTIWMGSGIPMLDEQRFLRLDGAATDYDLAQEVLTALLNDQHELIRTYVDAKIESEEPADIARGIMVAGFSDKSEFNDEILARYQGSYGLPGSAQKAAQYAYERNTWARHWFDQMFKASDNAEFWRYSVLFTKIVDGRVDVWEEEYKFPGSPFKLFFPSIIHRIDNRLRRWETQRKKTLFGEEAPAPIFLQIA